LNDAGPAAVRAAAANVVQAIVDQHRSLDRALPEAVTEFHVSDADRGLVQELSYGVVRWYWRLEERARRLMQRAPRRKDRDVFMLLLVGLYQLDFLDIPAHAAVNETVNAAAALQKPWAKGLINAVMRRAQNTPSNNEPFAGEAESSHPAWLADTIRNDWPGHAQQILAANNARPPMTARVNLARISRAAYLDDLASAGIAATADPRADAAIVITPPVSVSLLPGFGSGLVSIQDIAAQWAAPLVDARPGDRVLDACAAPGGKTAHLLERQESIELVAVEIDHERARMLQETLDRLGLVARIITADAAQPGAWWDGRPFQRILLDAPCSGTGVIRRHPDIKHLRQPADIERYACRQGSLLRSLWHLLEPGGRLLYVTCSILRRENDAVIAAFIASHTDAFTTPLDGIPGCATDHGVQVLPGIHDADGFYFSALTRENPAVTRG